jgi:hypothetical protein
MHVPRISPSCGRLDLAAAAINANQFGKRRFLLHQMTTNEASIRLVQLGAQQALETPDVVTMGGYSDSVQLHLTPRFVRYRVYEDRDVM